MNLKCVGVTFPNMASFRTLLVPAAPVVVEDEVGVNNDNDNNVIFW